MIAERLSRALASTLRPALYVCHRDLGHAGFRDAMLWALAQPRGSILIEDDTWTHSTTLVLHRSIVIRDPKRRIVAVIYEMPIYRPEDNLYVN